MLATGTRYHGDVGHVSAAATQRLAVLLAGGGATCRRLLATVSPTAAPLDGLRRAGAPRVLVETASRLVGGEVSAVLERVRQLGWRWAVPGEALYPERLLTTEDPPLGLFVRGMLGPEPVVAVVGSRRASTYGRQVARVLGEELAAAGVVVLSGMARGVDAAAHEGALAAGGPTAAVWGAGPDRVYPSEHHRLADAIAGCGALLTEYPPGTPPRRHHFPERNRLVAALAHAVVVVEAAARSGALVTARLAVDEGREVLAVPGSIFSDVSVGPNALLRLGARPALNTRDVLDAIGISPAPVVGRTADDPVQGVLEFLPRGEALPVDEIAAKCGSGVHNVMTELLELELGGKVERLNDGRYCRR